MPARSTPMMDQYRRIRKELPPDTILFFRLGDFYEMFFEDAKVASRILDIALTKRNKVPMCGVPYHASQTYLAKLIRAGVKVAICEQVEDPSSAKGIVRREVARVVTPGTVLEDSVLESHRNNYLAGLCFRDSTFGMAWLDLSTGAFWVEETADPSAVLDSLARYTPAECVVPEEDREHEAFTALIRQAPATTLSPHDDWTFEYETAVDTLTRHFKVHSLQGFGCDNATAGVCAAGAILHYVTHTLRNNAGHVTRLRVKQPAHYATLDEATTQNLDLVASRAARPSTLLHVLDATRTAMGGRLLREWILRPLLDLDAVRRRHDAVETFTTNRALLADTREALSGIKDMERLVARLGSGSGNARDLKSMSQSLSTLPAIKSLLEQQKDRELSDLAGRMETLPEVRELIDGAIEEEPPAHLKEGGIIRKGHHEELDTLREAATKGRQWIAEFQTREQERTGIKTLKVRHNKVFGYYIEITKTNLDAVPGDYTRKQTLVNAERFVTPELKEYEQKILGAQERSMELEYELFLQIRERVVSETPAIQHTAAAVAAIDVLASFAEQALANRYTRPRMSDGDRLHIVDGRHPVVERIAGAEPFVPNDCLLDTMENQLAIITGPNMAGKSTYIRQVALIVIMAQIGSFVPAAKAEIGLVDRVFTRVGASDDLVRGRSTFMVEMQETANILNNATTHSLIVLDEIGRGTSTFDGISIAWAVAEHLHNHAGVKAKTLFATHYHELTDLALTLPGVKNYNVLVREKNDRIAFLRKIVPGSADKSYGIQVARLAGLPGEVIDRAKEILTNLEEGEFAESGQPKIARHRPRKLKNMPGQMSFLESMGNQSGESD